MNPLRGLKNRFRQLLYRKASPEINIALDYWAASDDPIFPGKNVCVSDRVDSGPVLVLSPHPDDEAIGLGGALSMHLQQGVSVTVLYLTDGGGVTSDQDLVANRREEAKALGSRVGLNQIFWDYKDTQLVDDASTVNALSAVLNDLQPAIVYLPSFFDNQRDHVASNEVLRSALQTGAHSPEVVLGYEVWDQVPYPNHIIDISLHFPEKEAMISHYKTPLAFTDFIGLCAQRNALHFTLYVDSEKRPLKGYAEAFHRFDPLTYFSQFEQYQNMLKSHGSKRVSA